MKRKKHPNAIIIIHWLTVILFVVAIFLHPHPDELKLNAQHVKRFPPKIILGISILVLSIIRIILKRSYPDRHPPNIKFFKPFHKKVAKIVYYLIYILLLCFSFPW